MSVAPLWVGRRKEPILGYVPKNDEKKNFVQKGLKRRQPLHLLNKITYNTSMDATYASATQKNSKLNMFNRITDNE